ncbi:DJ-1/PfpI family protein [Ihubacter massiliensis]|uniref:DJ-1/PfpI family protein n=1 Tax=Hominibacterium faecale TaxID=2839743 RepID=A0A9J6QXU6_9FIRM|nr:MULTISPECIES: DJ-1 family glyoxalase III [Eubacteriales Family XIII. Incertae Sedis]MCO7122078.1 DJ-1/PfpI family protein [Ihubacter massiliensis]MCU7380264.1 DJ-1/PfpI family protein [Hominibacterium faecale]
MVYVHLADGFEEVEALTTVDLFRRAQIGVQTVSITGKKEVTGAHNVTVEADILFEETDYEQCEMIVLPGGMPGAEHLGNHEGLTSHIRCFAKNDKYIAAICAAPMVFGALGVLDGKKSTIYPGMEDKLGGADYQNEKVVVDGKIVTSMGPATAMPFALKLIELLKGKAASDEVAAGLLWNQK